jgi:hypothetical protein
MMEAASTSKTLVNFYWTTQRNNQEDSHLHTRRRENLTSRLLSNLRCNLVNVELLRNLYFVLVAEEPFGFRYRCVVFNFQHCAQETYVRCLYSGNYWIYHKLYGWKILLSYIEWNIIQQYVRSSLGRQASDYFLWQRRRISIRQETDHWTMKKEEGLKGMQPFR